MAEAFQRHHGVVARMGQRSARVGGVRVGRGRWQRPSTVAVQRRDVRRCGGVVAGSKQGEPGRWGGRDRPEVTQSSRVMLRLGCSW